MIVAVLTMDFYMPGSFSLKDKRAILRKIKDRVSHKYNVSIAEVEFMDKWQKARIGIAMVGNEYGFLDKSITTIFNYLDQNPDAEIIEHSIEYL